MNSYPNFQSKSFLREQIFNSLNFYYPRCIDSQRGGFFNSFLDDGSIHNDMIKHLVGTTRFIFVFSVGTLLDGPDWCLEMTERGIDFLRNHHLDSKNGGYHNEFSGLDVVNTSKQVYGHAHVILAAAMAYRAGLSTAKDLIDSTFELLEKHAWLNEFGLYADEFNQDWSEVSSKRGQNANMHLCEAMISAYEATGDRKYLDRAVKLAKAVTIDLTSHADGLIWETYNTDWTLDISKETKTSYGVYGFMIGHLAEWSKLLIILSRHHEEDWMLPKAEFLFRAAVDKGWDTEHKGLFYIFDFDGKILNSNKSWWVAAETIGASAVLVQKTGNPYYTEWYQKLWEHSWMHFVDHQYGAWYPDLSSTNQRIGNLKSPYHKTDYHPIGAMFESYNSL
jgi:mannose/cellobiose epimerase-like protein (N-acyl-D-glucosamine 2-epimerase family)